MGFCFVFIFCFSEKILEDPGIWKVRSGTQSAQGFWWKEPGGSWGFGGRTDKNCPGSMSHLLGAEPTQPAAACLAGGCVSKQCRPKTYFSFTNSLHVADSLQAPRGGSPDHLPALLGCYPSAWHSTVATPPVHIASPGVLMISTRQTSPFVSLFPPL